MDVVEVYLFAGKMNTHALFCWIYITTMKIYRDSLSLWLY